MKKKLSEIGPRCFLAACLAIMWVPATWSVIISSLISSKILLQPSDLIAPNTSTFSGISRVRCAAIAAQNPNSSYCSTTSRDCIAVKDPLFFPGYNNSNGKPFYHCFTYAKALFDKAAALEDCKNSGNCCPLPFQNITHLGCVYTPVFWWFPVLPYSAARKTCQGLWPTGDLFIKPTNWTALLGYFASRSQFNVWVGAARVGNTSKFEWHDGSAVADEDFGKESVLIKSWPGMQTNQQPDGRNYAANEQAIVAPDCLLVLTSATVNKLADDSCYRWTAYICLIT